MRAVFSAMWRSWPSAAPVLASPRGGARRTSRSVARTGILPSRKVSDGMWSRPVMAGSLGLVKKRRGEPASRLPSWNPKVPPVRLERRRTSYVSSGLLGRSLRHRNNGYEGAVFRFAAVLDAAVDQCKQRVVHAHPDIRAGMPLRAALAHDDVAGNAGLAAEQLYAQALAGRVTAVARGAACFLVCHGQNPCC